MSIISFFVVFTLFFQNAREVYARDVTNNERTDFNYDKILGVILETISERRIREGGKRRDLKIKSVDGDIVVSIKAVNDIPREKRVYFSQRIKFFQNMIGKRFSREVVNSGDRKIKPVVTIALLTEIYIDRAINDIKKEDLNFKVNPQKCFFQKKYKNSGEIKTVFIVLNASLKIKDFQECVNSVLFYSFYPGINVSSLPQGSGSESISIEDFMNMRIIYDERFPYKKVEIKGRDVVSEIIYDAKIWIRDCEKGLNGCGGDFENDK